MRNWAYAALVAVGVLAACGDDASTTQGASGTGAGGTGGAGTGGAGTGGGSECSPGEERSCYDGPAATEDVGTCHGGTQACMATNAWDDCVGQVVPAADFCISPEDENCDGTAAVCGTPWQTLIGDGGTNTFDISVGPDDSVVVVGQFAGALTVGGQTYTASSGGDGFVIKLSPEGAVDWARILTGLGAQVPAAVDVGPAGEVVVVGYYVSEANFGLGQTVTAQGAGDGFLWKLDASGTPQWVEIFSGTDTGNYEPLLDVSIDGDGTIAVSGYYEGLIDLGGVELPMANNPTNVVATLDPLGALQFHREIPGEAILRVGYEPGGDLIVSGTLGSARVIDLGQGPLTTEAFIASFGPTGAPGWVFPFGSTAIGQSQVGVSDRSGVIPLTSGGALFGHVSSSGTLDVGGRSLPTAGMFFFSVSGAGAYAASGTVGTLDEMIPNAFAASPDGGAVIGGALGPCPSSLTVAGQTYSCTGSGQPEAFLIRLDATGAAVDATVFGAPPDSTNIVAVDVDSVGQIVAVVSWYGSNVDFGAGTLPNGTWNEAVVRLGW